MEDVHVVRHKFHAEGKSVRRIASEMKLARNTVRRYLRGAGAGVRKPAERVEPERFRAARVAMDELLESSSSWTAKKQKLTAKRLHELIKPKHDVGYTFVKEHMRRWRQSRAEVFVPLVYRPGDLAEVDFFEVVVEVNGERQDAYLFVMRLMYARRDFVWLFPRQDQVCFLEGHVKAFERWGGVMSRGLYDNLKPAVTRILVGAERKLSERFLALAAHYGFEPCFARPSTGHDKGGVEARGKHIRWQSLVPVPSGTSLDDISEKLLLDVEARNAKQVGFDARWQEELRALSPLSPRPFLSSKTVPGVPVSRQSIAVVEGARYSVPTSWVKRTITAHIGVSEVELVGPDGSKEQRKRLKKGESDIDYARHYLDELSKKPQALRQVAPHLVEQLGEPFPGLWSRLCEEHGEREAARQMSRVLRGVLDLGRDEAVARAMRALEAGEPLAASLLVQPPPKPELDEEKLPVALRVEVAASSAADYDALCEVA